MSSQINTKNLDSTMTYNFIELYSDEWQYRYSQFTYLFIRLSIVVYGIIMFPYIPDAVHVNINNLTLPLITFPILGVLLSIIECGLLLSQNARLITISKKINDLKATISPEYLPYGYHILQRNYKKNKKNKVFKESIKTKFYKKRIGGVMALVNWGIQILLAGVITFFLIVK